MTKEQSKPLRAKVSQRPSVSSSKASAKDEFSSEASAKDESDAPTRAKRYFKRTTYIKGFGIVNAGDELTSEMAIAWSSNTKIKIDAYVGTKDECLISK